MNEQQTLAISLFTEMRKQAMFELFDLIKIQKGIDEEAKQAFKNLVAKPCKRRQKDFDTNLVMQKEEWNQADVIEMFSKLFNDCFLEEIRKIAFLSNKETSDVFVATVQEKINEITNINPRNS